LLREIGLLSSSWAPTPRWAALVIMGFPTSAVGSIRRHGVSYLCVGSRSSVLVPCFGVGLPSSS